MQDQLTTISNQLSAFGRLVATQTRQQTERELQIIAQLNRIEQDITTIKNRLK